MSQPPYDFFVSYARRDNANGWITSFVEALQVEHRRFLGTEAADGPTRDLNPYFDQHVIHTGADWQLHIAEGLAHSRLFLAFLSPNYFASEWCRREWRAWLDAEIAQHILTAGVRPIYIVEVPGFTGAGQLAEQDFARRVAELSGLTGHARDRIVAETPGLVRHLRRRQHTHNQPFCDAHAFYAEGLAALRRDDLRAVLDELARDLDHHVEMLARADASLSTVPPYNRNFTGRLEELLTLRERLVQDDRTGVIHGVHGLGGIGKTELAFAYAHAYASAYPGGRFLVRCEGKARLREAVLGQDDLTALFPEIGDEARQRPDTHYAAVLACLRQRLGALGHVLLVLDNVSDSALLEPVETDTIAALGPRLHLLATTRLAPAAASAGCWLALDRLPDDDALELLEKHRPCDGDAEHDAARRVVRRLGGFTLMIELVAAWLGKHREVTCAAFLERLGIEDIEALDALAEERDVHLRRHNDERRLAAVLDPTLDALPPEDRRALEYAALLPPDQVALPWLHSLVAGDFPGLAVPPRVGHPDPWQLVADRLGGLALLIRQETGTRAARLVRVHRVVQDRLRRRLSSDDLAGRQRALDALIKERVGALSRTTNWPEVRWELEPLEALAWLWAEEAPGEAQVRTRHPRASWLLNQVGTRRYGLAEWSRGEPLMRRALAIAERSCGADHSEVATYLNNLAQLLKATNYPDEAEPLMRRALAISERIYGADHPKVATRLNNLAALLLARSRLTEAEPLMRRALEIDERSYGIDHADVATDLNNLAQLLKATNRLDEAEPLMRRALVIDECSYGADHPQVAIRLNNLAALYHATSRLGEAEPLMRRALAVDERSYGADHPAVATDLNNLAQLLKATSRLDEAVPLMRRALMIDERTYGAEHPDVARDINNLAGLLFATDRLGEAEPLMRRALAIDERSYGAEHPEVAMGLSSLAQLLQKTNRLDEAEPLMRRAVSTLVTFTRATGHPHPQLRVVANEYTGLLIAAGKSREQIVVALRELAQELLTGEGGHAPPENAE